MTRSKGFTLLELMIAIALLGIVATLASAPLQNLVDTTRIKSAVSDLHSAMLFARSEAVKRRQDVHVKPSGGDWHNGWFVTTDAAGTLADCGVANSCLQVYEIGRVGVRDYTGHGQVIYNREGRLDNGSTLIIFCDDDWSTNRSLRYLYALAGNPRFLDCCSCASFAP